MSENAGGVLSRRVSGTRVYGRIVPVLVCGRGLYRGTRPALLAGRVPGLFEIVFRGSGDNNILMSAYGAGEPDHVPGSRPFNFGF